MNSEILHTPSDDVSALPSQPLRIGLLVDSLTLPAWVARVVGQIQSSGIARVVLVVRNNARPRRATLRSRIDAYRRFGLYVAFRKLEGRRFRVTKDAFAKTDIGPLVEGAAQLLVEPKQTRFSDYISDIDIETIRSHNLDVLLRFGFRILRGDILTAARHGVWSYHHADNDVNRGGPAGFWEVMEGHPVTGSILQVLSEDLDNGTVLYRSYAQTHPVSVTLNRNNYYWKSAAFVMRRLRDLANGNGGFLMNGHAISTYSQRLYQKPRNRDMLKALAKYGWRMLSRKVQRTRTIHQWFIAYRKSRPDARVPDTTLFRFRPMVPPKDRFWADPFPVVHDGRHYVFLEEFPYSTRRGHISVTEIGSDGTATSPVTVLERPYHLAYPHVFSWSGRWYMLPDTSHNRTLEIYRATNFPFAWELDTVMMENVSAADATLVERDGRWWLFAAVAEENALNYDELCIFYGPTPFGPWRPHPRNPVKSDVRSARPAGGFFCEGGELYRPAQNCSPRYGYGISVNRVTKLTPTEYEEVEVSQILPNWRPDLVATHTLNSCPGLTVIDAQARRRR